MEPVQTTIPGALAATLQARSRSLARRLLAGAGRASLVAYDLAPMVEAGALCHGVSASGDLVVAGLRDAAVPATIWHDTPLRVRLDVVKEAPEWAVRITACAVHLLGQLQWVPDDHVADYLLDAALPAELIELGSSPGGRVGIVRADRVLVHDSAGVTPLPFDAVVSRGCEAHERGCGSFPDAEQEWAVRDVVGTLAPWQAMGLVQAAALGWTSAAMLSTRGESACPHLEGQVFCVDVDRTGLTLMAVHQGEATVVFFAFARPVQHVDELADRLDQLIEEAEAVRPPRR